MQAVALVLLFGFFVMGLLAYRTYDAKPPIPSRVVDETGQTLYTAADVQAGQEVFLHNGLMQYGSVYGHGAYLGPDFTADYLHRLALEMRRAYGDTPEAAERVRQELRENRYDPRPTS